MKNSKHGSRYKDLTGKIIGNFKVISFGLNTDHHSIWKCKCMLCGNICYIATDKLKTTKSCGCYNATMTKFSKRKTNKNSNYFRGISKVGDLYRVRSMRNNRTYHLGKWDNLNDAECVTKITQSFNTDDDFF